eukprot:gb/GECG01010369.1/.p1 GENE.gb/GECG01010369.1/~~gb/GECG01010369.1/.p1  ORF type:complete len:534 (+),score=49.11 gb/GECG01010369.1/:1-1602(+)
MAAQPKPGLLEAIKEKCIPGWFIPGGCKVKEEETFASSIGRCLKDPRGITEDTLLHIQEWLCQDVGTEGLNGSQMEALRVKVLVACFLLSDAPANTAYKQGKLKDFYPVQNKSQMDDVVAEWRDEVKGRKVLEDTTPLRLLREALSSLVSELCYDEQGPPGYMSARLLERLGSASMAESTGSSDMTSPQYEEDGRNLLFSTLESHLGLKPAGALGEAHRPIQEIPDTWVNGECIDSFEWDFRLLVNVSQHCSPRCAEGLIVYGSSGRHYSRPSAARQSNQKRLSPTMDDKCDYLVIFEITTSKSTDSRKDLLLRLEKRLRVSLDRARHLNPADHMGILDVVACVGIVSPKAQDESVLHHLNNIKTKESHKLLREMKEARRFVHWQLNEVADEITSPSSGNNTRSLSGRGSGENRGRGSFVNLGIGQQQDRGTGSRGRGHECGKITSPSSGRTTTSPSGRGRGANRGRGSCLNNSTSQQQDTGISGSSGSRGRGRGRGRSRGGGHGRRGSDGGGWEPRWWREVKQQAARTHILL